MLITGAAGGIGSAAARLLAREGASLLLTDFDGDRARALAEDINAETGRSAAHGLRHDVASEEDWRHAVQAARDRLSGLSVLVNNAGVAIIGSVEELSVEDWRRSMSVNADSVFLGCKYALPLMRETQPGSIINISSISGLIAGHNMAGYNASKAAVWLLTKSVALHCARNKWDIRCNSIHPTFVKTPMLDGLGATAEEIQTKLARQVPIGRLGEADEVANAILYLASDESRFMTGAELKLDGGMSAM